MAHSSKSQGELLIPLKSVDRVYLRWFGSVWQRCVWLSCENLDVLLSMLILKSRKTHMAFLSRWSTLDSICWVKLGLKKFQSQSKLLLKYVEGELPKDGAVPWYLCDKVYGVAHVLKNH